MTDFYNDDEIGLDPNELALARELMDSIAGDDFDDVGEVDIIGDDIDEVGRRRPRRRRPVSRNVQRVVATAFRRGQQAAGRPMPMVQQRQTGGDTIGNLLGFESAATIAAGATANVEAEPQKPFKPQSLIVEDATIGDFVITDLRVGTTSLFASNDGRGVPCSLFKSDGVLAKLFETFTAQTSQKITLSVKNISGSPRFFRAGMVGLAAK
jgi:hypothetical protein